MKKTALILLLLTLLSRLLGLGRELVISYFYGVSMVSDAYFVASSIPTMVLDFVSAGVVTAYIPMLHRVQKQEGEAGAIVYTQKMMGNVLVLSVGLLLMTLLLAPALVRLLAAGFMEETHQLAVLYTRICLWGLLGSSIFGICTGFLQSRGNFKIPAMVGMPMSLVIIAGTVLSATVKEYFLPAAFALASVVQIGFMAPWMKKSGFVGWPTVDFGDTNLRKTLTIALPVIGGVSVNQLNLVVDKSLASLITPGGISALNYAGKLNLFIQGLFVSTLVAVLYPTLARLNEENKGEQVKAHLISAFGIINVMVVPITVGALFFSRELVARLFGRGAFDERALWLTSTALFFYAFGLLAFAYRDLLARSFYSMNDTKTPVKNALLGVMLNLMLNVVLSYFMGLGGLALGTSISATITTLLMFKSLRHRMGSLGLGRLVRDFPKLVGASLLMGLLAKGLYHVTASWGDGELLLSVGFGAGVYALLIYLMKIEEMRELERLLRSKLADRKRK